MKLTIGHLYPDLLNLYGDRGNIQCMMKRCEWRGIEAETIFRKILNPMSKTAAVFWLSVAAISFLGIITKPTKVPLKDFPLWICTQNRAAQDSLTTLFWKIRISPFPLWALKIMEDGHTSETTNLLETCSTDTEITEKTAVKAFSTKTSWELISMAPFCQKIPICAITCFPMH